MFKYFEVKSGQNRGHYIVIEKQDKALMGLLVNAQWGFLDEIDNYDFYKRHGAKEGQVIWTHSRFAGHDFNGITANLLVASLRRVEEKMPTVF